VLALELATSWRGLFSVTECKELITLSVAWIYGQGPVLGRRLG
jgi:hypothetical protein